MDRNCILSARFLCRAHFVDLARRNDRFGIARELPPVASDVVSGRFRTDARARFAVVARLRTAQYDQDRRYGYSVHIRLFLEQYTHAHSRDRDMPYCRIFQRYEKPYGRDRNTKERVFLLFQDHDKVCRAAVHDCDTYKQHIPQTLIRG